jgi:DNA-binding protein HU-beta
MRAKVAIVTHVVPASPLESAISTPPPAESSHFSGFLLNGAWSNAARIVYVSAASRPISALFAIKKEVSMAKAAAQQATVTLKHLAATLAGSHEMAKKQSETILGDFVGLVVKHLKKGDRIRIGGLGILQVRKRAARMGRNPATGEPIKIKASKKVAFRAAKELKEAV